MTGRASTAVRSASLPALVVTCEHGGNQIPRTAQPLFAGACDVLESHRGHDPGALELARRIAKLSQAPLIFSQTSRLLVELNRTLGHPRLFSEFTRKLPEAQREALIREHYLPYRQQVEREVAGNMRTGTVLHLSVHTFTPVMNGKTRRTDIGLLFDPRRPAELQFCTRWRELLREQLPGLAIHQNLPYRGTSDGFTTALRKVHPDPRYMGIEIEVNQKYPLGDKAQWRQVQSGIAQSLKRCVLK